MLIEQEMKIDECMVDWPKLEEIEDTETLQEKESEFVSDRFSSKAIELLREGIQFGNVHEQHTVKPIQGTVSRGISSKYIADEFGLFYGRILFQLKDELDQMGLHLSLINTEHNEKVIVISQNQSPIDGAYIMIREPKE